MRLTAIGQDHHQRRPRRGTTGGDQTAAAEAFVVGVRCEDEAGTGTDHIVQRPDREGAPALVQFAGGDHKRSGIGCAAKYAAASVSTSSGAG